MKVGEKMKAIRESRGFTQAMVANDLGIAQAHISRVESGKAKPSGQLVKLFCQTYGVLEDWLLSEEEERPLQYEIAEGIADAYTAMVLKVAMGYLNILSVEIGNLDKRIKDTEWVTYEKAPIQPRAFFREAEPIHLPANHPTRLDFESLLRMLSETIKAFQLRKERVEKVVVFDKPAEESYPPYPESLSD